MNDVDTRDKREPHYGMDNLNSRQVKNGREKKMATRKENNNKNSRALLSWGDAVC